MLLDTQGRGFVFVERSWFSRSATQEGRSGFRPEPVEGLRPARPGRAPWGLQRRGSAVASPRPAPAPGPRDPKPPPRGPAHRPAPAPAIGAPAAGRRASGRAPLTRSGPQKARGVAAPRRSARPGG